MPMPWDKAVATEVPEEGAPPPGMPTAKMPWEKAAPEEPPATGFFSEAGKTISEAYTAAKAKPGQIIPGAAEALAAGVTGLGTAAFAGVGGLAGAVKGAVSKGDTAMEGFTRWKGAVEQFAEKIPVAPETEVGNKLLNVLGIIPAGIHAAGETTYEAMKSPALAAGTEALVTLLTLRPSVATKALRFAKTGDTPAAKTASDAFDTLAKERPEQAQQLAQHVDDPKLAKELQARIEEITVGKPKQVKEIFAQAKGRGPGALAVAPADVSQIMRGEWPGTRAAEKPAATPEQAADSLHTTVKEGWELLGGKASRAEALPQDIARVEKPADPTVQKWVDKSQAGQIHPDLLTFGISKLLTKKRSEDIVRMFAGTYNKERLASLITAAQDPRSRETVVWMKPVDFRKLARPRSWERPELALPPETAKYYAEAAEAKRVSVREGLKTKEGLHDIPFLYIGQTKTPGLARVWGHEGRHRTDVFTEKGLDLIPVRIVHKNMLPSERLSDVWPKELQSETGRHTLSMPERAVYPPGEGPIDVPFRYEDPVVYMNMGIPVTKAQLEKAFSITSAFLKRNIPHYDAVEKEVAQSAEMAIRSAAPEMLGKDAKAAAAILGKNQAVQMQAEVQQHHAAATRRTFWNMQGPTVALDFLKKYEKGAAFDNPILNKAAEGYRALADQIYKADQSKGIKYDARENYMAHIFEDNEAAAEFFTQRFGPKWNDPSFTKERGWDFIEEAIKPVSQGGGGLRLKYTNPEDIILARQHASDVAHMRVDMLSDLEQYGLARKAEKGRSPGAEETEYRSPNGQRYWVKGDARQVVHNAFNTKSLWEAKGIGGAAFRGAMGLKNSVVPIMLNLSLFHPVHVLFGMYNGSIMARMAKERLAGTRSTADTFAGILKAQAFTDLPKDWQLGSRVYSAYQGKIADAQLTPSDRVALQCMNEGGLVPMIQSHFKMQSIERMKDALDQGQVVKAAFHAPFALVQALQRPTMEVLVPRLKVASYLRDVQTALKVDPSLADNPLRRMEAFRKIMKQTENRFGEMAYTQRFWNKTVKDVGVATSLSMGWTLGFLDEFGAGPLRAGKSLRETKSLKESAIKGDLDQALFVGAYVTTAMLAAGVITYAMTGKPPEGMDYVLPRTGDTNPDGTPERMNTPFYTREYVSIGKHMQEKGVLSGVGQYFANKAAPTIGLAWEWFVTNQNYFGQELSDPESDVFTRQAQKLASVYKDIEPISIRQLEQRGGGTPAQIGRSLAGFGPAPSYATTTPAVSYIKDTFRRTSSHMTPYEQVPYSEDARKLRTAYLSGDTEAYNTLLDKMQEKYPDLTPKKLRALEKGLNVEPEIKMFKRLKVFQQKRALDKMTAEERDKFLPHASKELRYSYEPGAEE